MSEPTGLVIQVPNSSHIETILELLRAEKDRILAEIRSYPPPIPACDAQYNYLVEQRTYVNLALNRAERVLRAMAAGTSSSDEIHAFVKATEPLARRLQEAISGVLEQPSS